MSEQTKEFWLISQEEANYTPVSTVPGKACSSCRFFQPAYDDMPDRCHIVANWPEPIVPNGISDRHEVAPVYEPEPLAVVIVGEASTDTQVKAPAVTEDGIVDRIWKRIEPLLPKSKPQPINSFAVQKDLNGEWRWIATFTNNFQDRDKEIISDKALDGYLDRLNAGLIPYPELWVGHVEETKHGVADTVFGVGNFLVATGTFDDTPEAQKAIQYYRKYAAKTPLSHGFTFPDWGLKDGVYEVINTFEISTLPPPLVASNPYTDLEIESMKQINENQQAALAQVFGKDFTEQLVASRKQMSEDVKAAGVAFKDFVEAAPEQTEGEADKPADTKPIADMIVGLHEGMGEILNLLTASGKAYEAEKQARSTLEQQVKAQNEIIQQLQTELKLKPRAASASSETALSKEEADKVIADLPNDDDKFWS